MNRRWAWIALVVLAVVALVWSAWPASNESTDARVKRIASELRCIECEGLSVADASTSTARATREEIRERIDAGESDSQIRKAYVDRYGENALLKPTGRGVGVIVWGLPVVAMSLAGTGLFLGVRRWRGVRDVWSRRGVVTVIAVALFAVAAGIALAYTLGARLPGGLPSGNEAGISAAEREDRLRQAVLDNPDDADSLIALANFLVQEGDLAGALEAYDGAAVLDPVDPVPPAQAGWILFLSSTAAADSTQRTTLLTGALERVDRASEIDPDYPDARFYRGMILFRGFGDANGAVPEFQRFLVLAPDNPLAEEVRAVLAEAVAAEQ